MMTRELERGDRMPQLGEHVMFGGLRCLVTEADDETGSVTLLPLEDLPEWVNAALWETTQKMNLEKNRKGWRHSPQCGGLPQGSLYDKNGNPRPLPDVLDEIVKAEQKRKLAREERITPGYRDESDCSRASF